MPNQPAPETELLRAAYAAFNARDIDAALALMTPEVEWPRAFKGGFVRGPEAIRAYWTEQWSEINPHVEPVAFHPEDAGHVLVEVHQVVRDLAGTVVADEHVGHRFTIDSTDGSQSASIVRSLKPSGWADLGRSSPLRGCGDFALLEPMGCCLLRLGIWKDALQTPPFHPRQPY
jgi:ketosteroid isomerase-like protein